MNLTWQAVTDVNSTGQAEGMVERGKSKIQNPKREETGESRE